MITKTPLKFPYQAEQKNLILSPPPPYLSETSVTDIILPILESVESANPETLRKSMLCTIEAHSQTDYTQACAVQLMHIISKIKGVQYN